MYHFYLQKTTCRLYCLLMKVLCSKVFYIWECQCCVDKKLRLSIAQLTYLHIVSIFVWNCCFCIRYKQGVKQRGNIQPWVLKSACLLSYMAVCIINYINCLKNGENTLYTSCSGLCFYIYIRQYILLAIK